VKGKTISERFSSLASLAKEEREVDECRRFRELDEQLSDVNEQICRLRPVEGSRLQSRRKTAEATRQ
jgi:hypothetical protein